MSAALSRSIKSTIGRTHERLQPISLQLQSDFLQSRRAFRWLSALLVRLRDPLGIAADFAGLGEGEGALDQGEIYADLDYGRD